jgi:hypothetical protein
MAECRMLYVTTSNKLAVRPYNSVQNSELAAIRVCQYDTATNRMAAIT